MTTCTVTIREAKKHFPELLARANAGEEIIICKAGKPYAKLIAIEQASQRELGFLRDNFTDEELEAMDKALMQPLSEEEQTLWLDG